MTRTGLSSMALQRRAEAVRWACHALGIDTPAPPTESPSAAGLAAAEFVLELLEAEPPDLGLWAQERERWLVASEACALVERHVPEGTPLVQFTGMMRDAAAVAAIRRDERLELERRKRIHQLAGVYLHVLEVVVAGRREWGLDSADGTQLMRAVNRPE
jgi:hypothetical protein